MELQPKEPDLLNGIRKDSLFLPQDHLPGLMIEALLHGEQWAAATLLPECPFYILRILLAFLHLYCTPYSSASGSSLPKSIWRLESPQTQLGRKVSGGLQAVFFILENSSAQIGSKPKHLYTSSLDPPPSLQTVYLMLLHLAIPLTSEVQSELKIFPLKLLSLQWALSQQRAKSPTPIVILENWQQVLIPPSPSSTSKSVNSVSSNSLESIHC